MSGARVTPGRDGVHELWLDPGGPPSAASLAALVAEAFADGAVRLEARVDLADRDTLRALSRAGLRREGVLRRADGEGTALMARLAGDPEAGTHEAFIAMLNAGLPRKRAISQGVLRDPEGRVLLCELTYKREWDLPGGVVEPAESPADGLARELREELGTGFDVGSLLTVNWLPPWRQWDDACVFVFDLGVVPTEAPRRWDLQPTEIVAVHWCEPHEVAERAAAATVTLLEGLAGEGTTAPDGRGPVPYREAGLPR